MSITLPHFLIVAALVLLAGIITMIAKRNAVGILMGVELIVSAAMINFAAFNAFLPPVPGRDAPRIEGNLFTLFIMVLAAAQAAIAVAVMINLHQTTGTVDVEQTERTGGQEGAEGGTH